MREVGMSEGERIAQAFVAARREAQALPSYPGRRPETLEQAYAIQDHAIALRGVAVGGWKVGRINPPLDAHFGTNRLAGPIFVDQIVPARPSRVLRSGAVPSPAAWGVRGTIDSRTVRAARAATTVLPAS
jgi:2-keto-4-pentenoate hydratase